MPLTLDPQTEQRIQHELELGKFENPAELINYALDLIHPPETDSLNQVEAVRAHIEEGWQQAERGEVVSSDRLKQLLAEQRADFAR